MNTDLTMPFNAADLFVPLRHVPSRTQLQGHQVVEGAADGTAVYQSMYFVMLAPD